MKTENTCAVCPRTVGTRIKVIVLSDAWDVWLGCECTLNSDSENLRKRWICISYIVLSTIRETFRLFRFLDSDSDIRIPDNR